MCPTNAADPALKSGLNSLVEPAQALDAAVEGSIEPAALVPVGTSVEVTLCRTATELNNALQEQLGLSAGLAALPIPLLGYRREFQQTLHTTVFSLSLVVKAKNVMEGFEVRDSTLKIDPSTLASHAALDAFVRRHGDCWVRRVHLGGEVLGVYTLYAQTREESTALLQKFGGSILYKGVSLTPELAKTLQSVSRESSVNMTLKTHVFGTHQQPALATPDDLIAYVNTFGAQPLEAPVVLHMETSGYESLPGLWEVFQPVVANRELFRGKDGLLRKRQRLAELENQCHWVAQTLRLYGQTPDPSLATTSAEIEGAIQAIDHMTESFRTSASTPLQTTSLPNLSFPSPRLVPTFLQPSPLCLGSDDDRHGDPFDFKDRAKAIQRRRRLAKVILNSDGYPIDQIRLTYVQDLGANNSETQPQEWTEAHPEGLGRGKDSLPLELDLDNGEQITTINANSGTGVDQLEFITNTQQRISGGRPSTGGRASSWTASPHQVLLGFEGRSKTWLDCLKPVVADFSTALRWEQVNEDEDL
jgi:hypothetical protein